MEKDCVRVWSLEGFNLAVDKDCASLYLMPYLPLLEAAKIQQEVEAGRLWLMVLNPELLTSKVSILKTIEEEIRMLKSRLEGEDKLDSREDDGRLPVSDREEEEEEECLARGLAKFRRHQQNSLLFAHARQGNWAMTRKMLQQLYPKVYSIIPMEKPDDDGHVAILKQIDDISHMFPYSEQADIDELSCDLVSILATEDWGEQKQIARSRPSLKACGRDAYEAQMKAQISLFRELCEEPSLLGAADPLLAVTALKRQLDSLKSFAISKGHVGDNFCHSLLPDDSLVKCFSESGAGQIDELFKLVDRISVDFVDVKKTMEKFNKNAMAISALKLKRKCDKFIRRCEEKDVVRCIKVLHQVKDNYVRVHFILQLMDELLKVIRHY